jgi:hypothetical protein
MRHEQPRALLSKARAAPPDVTADALAQLVLRHARSGARYHGGSPIQAVEPTVGILRPEVTAQVSKFLRASQQA